MRPRSSLSPHSGAAPPTHSQLTVDAPPTGTTAPSTAQGALWMVLASGAVGVAYGTFFLAHTCYLSPSKLTYNMLIDTGLCCLPKFMVVGTPPCLFVYARPNSNSWSNGPRKHSTCAHHLCLNGQHHIPHKTCIAYRVR